MSILDQTYGAGFSSIGVGAYSNGTVTATRVDDFLSGGGTGGLLNQVSGGPGSSATDQFWTDGISNASVEAKFASFSQQFGYDSGSGFTKLFDVAVTGSGGFNVSGSGNVSFGTGTTWQWARSGAGGTFYSGDANNADGLDHMTTYKITGAPANPNETVWLLMWEDLTGPLGGSGGSDRDFNDLAVELRAQVIPLPGAWLLGAAGLGLVALVKRRLL